MADAETKPVAPLTDAQKTAAERKLAIAAWHDATTDEQKKAAVKQYPVLVTLYSIAQNFQ